MRGEAKKAGRVKRGAAAGGQADLEAANLRAEICLLRELLQEVVAQVQPDGSKEYLLLLDGVGRACGQLARLLRTQDQLGDQATLADEIGRIADEVRQELTRDLGE
jgi:hypothetical protein